MANVGKDSIVYRGPPSVSYKPGINPQEINSSKNEYAISTTSWPYGEKYDLSITKDGNMVFRTANNTWYFPLKYENIERYGTPTSWDEAGPQMDGFIRNGEDNRPLDNDVIGIPPSRSRSAGAVESLDEKVASFDVRDTPLVKYIHPMEISGVRNNDVGYAASKLYNSKEGFLKFLRSEDGGQSYAYLTRKGKKPVQIDYIGTGLLGEAGILGVIKTIEGYVILSRAWDADEKISEWASAAGMKFKDIEELLCYLEEQIHLGDGSLDNIIKTGDVIGVETGTKAEKLSYLRQRQKDTEGISEKNQKYSKAAGEAERDLANVERYASRNEDKESFGQSGEKESREEAVSE